MDKQDRREMESMLLHLRFMLKLNESWYLGIYYSRRRITLTLQELERVLKKEIVVPD